MNRMLGIFLSLIALHAAAEPHLPKGCRAIAIQGETVMLTPKKEALFFIHNQSATDLWITHPVTDKGVSAGWTSRIQADHWSALSVAKAPFALNCIESKPGHEQQIPCEGVLLVCQWAKIKIPEDAKSTFWVAEDKSLSEITAAVGSRGFKVPVPE